MALSTYDFIYGIAQFAAAFLSVVAGLIALSMFQISHKQKLLRAWKFLIIALVLFAVQEVIGALDAFGLYNYVWETHVLVSILLVFFMAALITQISINKGWAE